MSNVISQFKEAMYAVGMTPPDYIEADGKLRRFASGDKKGDKNGWYVFHEEGIPAGAFGCWQKGINETWRANIGRALTPSEVSAHQIKMEAVKQQRESEKLILQAEAKANALDLWSKASSVIDHPYTKSKQINPFTARQYQDSLLIPVCEDGKIQSLQFINADGSKRFLTGGKVAGCYFSIGKTDNAQVLCICEGFATGASIHEATGYPVAIAFNAGNLLAVAKVMQEKYPNLKLIICGDDDHKTEGNPGKTKATETALEVNGVVAIPSFGLNRKDKATDFNDMAQEVGLEAVKKVVEASLENGGVDLWEDPIELPQTLPVQSFDYELLPESLRPWIKDIANRMQCPPDFPAVAAIVCASSLIGAKAVIQPKDRDSGWQVTPNLWGMIIGRAGAFKSPPIKAVMSPINKLEALAREENDSKLNDWQIELELAEVFKTKLKGDTKKLVDKGDVNAVRSLLESAKEKEPSEPISKRYVVNDSSVERLQEIMAQNPWGLMCFRDEIFGLLKDMDKQGQEGARAFYLTCYDGNQSYSTDRIGREDVTIPRACLSLLGTIQPSRLGEYIGSAVHGGKGDDGLLQRFGLMVYPDSIDEYKYVDGVPNKDAQEEAWDVFKRLSELQPNGNESRVWKFSPDAQELFLEWFIPFNQELLNGELHPAIESHLSKYRKLVPALALVFAQIDTPNSDGLVGITELARALDWYEYLRSHAERIYQSSTAPESNGAKAILAKIKSKDLVDGFTCRDINRKEWAGLRDLELIKKSVALLSEYDYLKLQVSQSSSNGGRPSEKYFINPKVFGAKDEIK